MKQHSDDAYILDERVINNEYDCGKQGSKMVGFERWCVILPARPMRFMYLTTKVDLAEEEVIFVQWGVSGEGGGKI